MNGSRKSKKVPSTSLIVTKRMIRGGGTVSTVSSSLMIATETGKGIETETQRGIDIDATGANRMTKRNIEGPPSIVTATGTTGHIVTEGETGMQHMLRPTGDES